MSRFALRQTVVAGYAAAILVCAVGWLAFRSASGAAEARRDAQRFGRTVIAVRRVGAVTREAESAQRTFLLTGDDRDLARFSAMTDSTRMALAQLRAATSDARFAPRVDSLAYFVGLALGELGQTARLRRDAGVPAVVNVLRSERSGQPALEVERLLDALSASVDRAAMAQSLRAERTRDTVFLVAALAGLLALLVAALIHRREVRGAREQRHITDELEAQSEQLHLQTVELRTANAELEAATRELVERTLEAERSETRLAGVLASATDAIVSFDDERRIVYVNAAAERLFGADADALTNAHIARFLAGRSEDEFDERVRAARRAAHLEESGAERWDTIVERVDGSEVPVEVSVSYARTGRKGLFTALLRDVTRQRQLEAEFRQAQKMEAVGRLAGGIAHDFNNLLTVIGATSDFLLLDVAGDSRELARDIKEIKRATDRAASLTRQLLAFSRRQLVQPQMLDLNAVVQDMEKMLQRLIGEDVTLSTEYDPEIGLVRLDRGQLEQIVVNLVVNARDAMPEGGVVRVRTQGVADRNMPAGVVTLSVSDTGVGMDEETRSRIFEPFFTTKEQGKGTGLGLSTVYGIVTQAGGQIGVASEIDAGTTFTLAFPVAEEEEQSVLVAPVPLDTLRGDETVLVVEDEEPLRRLTRRILESRGYRVLDAADGAEAIRVMASTPWRVDLILSDVVMPGMSGRELVERILPVYPWMRVLFMSGYTEDTILHHRVSELGMTVLEKPFTPEDLARAVRGALDRTADIGDTPAAAAG